MKNVCILFLMSMMTVAFDCMQLFAASAPAAAGQKEGIQVGVFYLCQGLSYWTPTQSGTTNKDGEFHYRPGETVTFSVGGLVFGSAPAKKQMTSADLFPRVEGNIRNLNFPDATNLARFIQSLGESDDVDDGIVITQQTAAVVSRYVDKIHFLGSEAAFSADPNVTALFGELHKILRSGPQARNYVRWAMLGVQVKTDQKIMLRNGLYVLADVYRPIAPGKYPSIVDLSSYGKAFGRTCICNPNEALDRAAGMDAYFEDNPKHMESEAIETPNPEDWVPKGYAVVAVDAPGLCNNPGVLNPYSVEDANAYFDSIVWATQQPWSNGSIGLMGASAYGIDELLVAQLHPTGLKALIVSAADYDRYNGVIYAGGILNATARNHWWSSEVEPRRCLNQKTYEDTYGSKQDFWLSHPFDDPAEYGTYFDNPPMEASTDLSKITYPLLQVAPVEHPHNEHVTGSVETYMRSSSQVKMLRFVPFDFNGSFMYNETGRKLSTAWFDHWLKGEDNGVLNQPKVQAMLRTGHGGWFWQSATEYPVPNTKYTKLYLNAQPSSWSGDGKRKDFLDLSTAVPSAEASQSYSADVDMEKGACWQPGISFVSQPLTKDMKLMGYIYLRVWVSSSSSDMDIFASLRVMGPNNKEIPYALSSQEGYYPVGKGWQRVSYRALDPKLSTAFRPMHLNTKDAYAPLKSSSELVPVDLQLEPTNALIHKGDRIRLDIQPVDGCDWGTTHPMLDYRVAYHRGASNTIYTGGDHASYVQLPIIPAAAMSNEQSMK